MILNTFEVGGSNPQFWKLQFTHDPLYAVAQFCEVKVGTRGPAERAAAAPARVRPQRRNRASSSCPVTSGRCGCRRSSPSACSSILFVLGLLMLHWREKDEIEAEAKKQEQQQARISS